MNKEAIKDRKDLGIYKIAFEGIAQGLLTG